MNTYQTIFRHGGNKAFRCLVSGAEFVAVNQTKAAVDDARNKCTAHVHEVMHQIIEQFGERKLGLEDLRKLHAEVDE